MQIPSYSVNAAIPLDNEQYLPYLLQTIAAASRRLWASVFIVDARLHEDTQLSVRKVIDALAYARWRGLDVRVILGVSSVKEIYVANLTSALFMAEQQIPVRLFHSMEQSSTHNKYLMADDQTLIVGSHNWTHHAFHHHINGSLVIQSRDIVAQVGRQFLHEWGSSQEVSQLEN